jgi:hypothetical protein
MMGGMGGAKGGSGEEVRDLDLDLSDRQLSRQEAGNPSE